MDCIRFCKIKCVNDIFGNQRNATFTSTLKVVKHVSFQDTNHLLASLVSSLFMDRFHNTLNSGISQLAQNLVAFSVLYRSFWVNCCVLKFLPLELFGNFPFRLPAQMTYCTTPNTPKILCITLYVVYLICVVFLDHQE